MLLLNRYELLKGYNNHSVAVGFGAYGQVKLALDRQTGHNVAVKIVTPLINRLGSLLSMRLSSIKN